MTENDMAERAGNLVIETVEDGVCVLQLNRPEVRNALNFAMVEELGVRLARADRNRDVRVIVITGDEKAFAAGADITELVDGSFKDFYINDDLRVGRESVSQVRKPVIAAVSGFALGGGAEIAMMCDIIVASETAKFGQPEILIGTLPGAGGTQRLTRAIGKYKAMEICLTGRMVTADEAERIGLVTKVVPAAAFMEEVLTLARAIAAKPPNAAMYVKEAILRSQEIGLTEGLRFERRLFHASVDQTELKEGARAFIEKTRARPKAS